VLKDGNLDLNCIVSTLQHEDIPSRHAWRRDLGPALIGAPGTEPGDLRQFRLVLLLGQRTGGAKAPTVDANVGEPFVERPQQAFRDRVFYPDHRPGSSLLAAIAGIFSERAFVLHISGSYFTLDDDLSGGGNGQIDSLAIYQLDWLAANTTRNIIIIVVVVVVLCCCCTIASLLLLGPALGNVFSNIILNMGTPLPDRTGNVKRDALNANLPASR
jgi:hypothetical protein